MKDANYSKFMKYILSKKKNVGEFSIYSINSRMHPATARKSTSKNKLFYEASLYLATLEILSMENICVT